MFLKKKKSLRLSCYHDTSEVLPSKAVDKESDGEGAKDATNREDGDSDGPDGCERVLTDGLLVAGQPRLIDKIPNDLQQGGKKREMMNVFIQINNMTICLVCHRTKMTKYEFKKTENHHYYGCTA